MNRSADAARAFAVAALVALGVVACADSPTEPSKPFEGTWMGAITTTLDGAPSGTATATLTQDGSQVRGSLHTIYSVPPNSGGSFSNFVGTASGTFLSAIVTNPAIPNPASCPYRLSLTLNGTLLTGTFASEFFCPVAFTGTFDLKKQ